MFTSTINAAGTEKVYVMNASSMLQLPLVEIGIEAIEVKTKFGEEENVTELTTACILKFEIVIN